MPRKGFDNGESTSCRKEYVDDKSFLRNRAKLWYQVRRIFIDHKLGPSKKNRSSFMLISGDGEKNPFSS